MAIFSNNLVFVSAVDPRKDITFDDKEEEEDEDEEDEIDFLLLFLSGINNLSCFAFIFIITTSSALEMSGMYLGVRKRNKEKNYMLVSNEGIRRIDREKMILNIKADERLEEREVKKRCEK